MPDGPTADIKGFIVDCGPGYELDGHSWPTEVTHPRLDSHLILI